MDLTCFNWVQLIKKSDLPSNAKYMAYYLSTFMNLEHDIAWPSQRRISDETGLSEPTVRKWLEYLAERDWLVIRRGVHEVVTKGGIQMQNEYIVNIPEETLRRVSSLPGLSQGGKTVGQRGVNESSKVGKQFTPNNNRNNNKNNNVSKSAKMPNWKDDEAWVAFGEQRGITARSGENWNDFKKRVKAAVEAPF